MKRVTYFFSTDGAKNEIILGGRSIPSCLTCTTRFKDQDKKCMFTV